MTLAEFIEDLQSQVRDHPKWADRDVRFATSSRSALCQYASIYSARPDDDSRKQVVIDLEETGR